MAAYLALIARERENAFVRTRRGRDRFGRVREENSRHYSRIFSTALDGGLRSAKFQTGDMGGGELAGVRARALQGFSAERWGWTWEKLENLHGLKWSLLFPGYNFLSKYCCIWKYDFWNEAFGSDNIPLYQWWSIKEIILYYSSPWIREKI